MNIYTKSLFAVLVAGLSGASLAGPISCPGTVDPLDTEFTLTTSPTATCLAFGDGNINGNNDAINALGYETLDKTDDAVTGLTPFDWLTTSPGLGGTFSFTAPAGYGNFVIAFKTGGGQNSPSWAAFLLPAGVTSGDWAVSGQNVLSHANLYGVEGGGPPNEAPEPQTLALLGLGLFGVAWLRRKRRG